MLVGSIIYEFNFRIPKGHLRMLDTVDVRSHPVKILRDFPEGTVDIPLKEGYSRGKDIGEICFKMFLRLLSIEYRQWGCSH